MDINLRSFIFFANYKTNDSYLNLLGTAKGVCRSKNLGEAVSSKE